MTKEEVQAVITHTGDVYIIKLKNRSESFRFYVSKIGSYGLTQTEGGGLAQGFISYESIEWVKAF